MTLSPNGVVKQRQSLANFPTAITLTDVPVVILKPVVAFVARMPRRTVYGADCPVLARQGRFGVSA